MAAWMSSWLKTSLCKQQSRSSEVNTAPALHAHFPTCHGVLYVDCQKLRLQEWLSPHKEHRKHAHPSVPIMEIYYSCAVALCCTFSHEALCLWTGSLQLSYRALFTSGPFCNNVDFYFAQENTSWYVKGRKKQRSLEASHLSPVHKRREIGVDRFVLLRWFAGLYLRITASYFDQTVAYWVQQLNSSIVASPVVLHHSLAQRYADCPSYLMLLVVPWFSVNGLPWKKSKRNKRRHV